MFVRKPNSFTYIGGTTMAKSLYSRPRRQPKHDVGSCIIDTQPNIALSYGYLTPTEKVPTRISYTSTQLRTDAQAYIRESRSFEEFEAYVRKIYTDNPDFVWNTGKKSLFTAHMKQLKQNWPR